MNKIRMSEDDDTVENVTNTRVRLSDTGSKLQRGRLSQRTSLRGEVHSFVQEEPKRPSRGVIQEVRRPSTRIQEVQRSSTRIPSSSNPEKTTSKSREDIKKSVEEPHP